ncbi:MAG: phosphoribosylglycinamide formyltransferase, partial [Bacteroidetes bacterium]
HYVNTKSDEGNIIFQAKCALEETDSPEEIAKKVLTLEHKYFAQTIEKLLKNQS